jgi:threonine aldolase
MRQVGIFAAAGLHALEHHFARLAEDHANARLIATRLATSPRVELDLKTVQTNIVVFRLAPRAPDSGTVVAQARERGLVLFPFGPRTMRLVTHLDVSRADCERAADILLAAIGS